MQSISHNISKTIDPITVEILEIVNMLAEELGLPYFLVGATARDMLMHHVHGANVQRATEDYDFAIEIRDWQTFKMLKQRLIERGFTKSEEPQRLVKGIIKVDLIPFGQIAGAHMQIDWPPEGDFSMSVIGFDDVFVTLAQQLGTVLVTEDKQLLKRFPDSAMSLSQALRAQTRN